MARSSDGRTLCPRCFRRQGAIDLPTVTIRQIYTRVCNVSGSGTRTECREFDLDPMRAHIEFRDLPTRKR